MSPVTFLFKPLFVTWEVFGFLPHPLAGPKRIEWLKRWWYFVWAVALDATLGKSSTIHYRLIAVAQKSGDTAIPGCVQAFIGNLTDMQKVLAFSNIWSNMNWPMPSLLTCYIDMIT